MFPEAKVYLLGSRSMRRIPRHVREGAGCGQSECRRIDPVIDRRASKWSERNPRYEVGTLIGEVTIGHGGC